MSKITQYATLSSPASNDLLVIVDVDDTTMAVTGTTKQITVNNLSTPVIAALTDAATILVDASQGAILTVTLGGNRTLGNPSNSADGMRRSIRVAQPGAGGPYTLAYGTAYEFTAQLAAPTLSVAANAIDELGFEYVAAKSKWVLMAYMLGI